MKNIILVALIATTFTCKAQSPIIDINDRDIDFTDGTYLKDTNNVLDKYVGTWVYTNGITSLTVKFEKKIQAYNEDWYEDIIVGEYKYIENGVEKVNTLPNFDNGANLESLYDHNLIGNTIIYNKEFPGCNNCEDLERRLRIYFRDPDPLLNYLDGSMYMGLRYISEFGATDKMQIDFIQHGSTLIPENAPLEPNLPFGRYVLIKQ